MRILICGLQLMGILFFFSGCNFNRTKGEPQAVDKGGNKVNTATLSLDYVSVNTAVLGPRCLNCHSASGGNQGGLSLENFDQVRANLNKIYFRSIEKRDMPSSPLTAAQFELLKLWIEAGGPLKNTGKNSGTIKGPITWDVIKKQVLGSSCLDCHSGPTPDGQLNLETLENVRTHITAIFESAIVKQTMPLQPYAALSDSEKQALMVWISKGMPQ